MINRNSISDKWTQDIVAKYDVPKKLHDHQIDTISLLQQGKHVFLGIVIRKCYHSFLMTSYRSSYRSRQNSSTASSNSAHAR